MVTAKVNFRHMKNLARRKVALLKRAQPSSEVTQMLSRLQRSIQLLDECGGMGFQVSFVSRAAMVGKKKAGGTRAKRG